MALSNEEARRIDQAIAEKVMGWIRPRPEWVKLTPDSPWVNPENGKGYHPIEIPNYSTNIAAAWEVVEKLEREFKLVQFHLRHLIGIKTSKWLARGYSSGNICFESEGETAPHAICLVALESRIYT